MLAWIDDVAGTPTLRTQRGSGVGCESYQVLGGDAFLLAPHGQPVNTVRAVDVCDGDPLGGRLAVRLTMGGALEDALTWDPDQQRPPIFSEFDADGYATFSLRGGGCSEAGLVTVDAFDNALKKVWAGAKSPDVDGDCSVDADDRAYVVAQSGTDDFCADLDGSGIVDAADVAIVDATLGDECEGLVSTGEVAPPVARMLTAWPNPARVVSHLEIMIPNATDVTVTVWDATGRLVRSLGANAIAGGRGVIDWDLRDDRGAAVASGVYFMRAESSEESLTRRLQVLR
jgi:hypothetical protein